MKVGIVSPSGFLSGGMQKIEKGIEYIKSLGMKPVLGKHVFDEYRYMAGTPEARARDIMDFFKDPEIEAIFCTRGGAGSQFVLDFLDYDVIKKNPKPVFGFSDGTALQLALHIKANNPVYSGFLLGYDFGENMVKESFRKIINKEKFEAKGGETVIAGKSKGVLIGGCLSLFRNLCGTLYYPDLSGVILLLEDVGEYTYKLELMLQQIKQNPSFDKIKGIVFGKFADCIEKDKGDGTIDEVIEYFCKDIKVPVIKSFNYGHIKERYVLPIGAKVELDADECSLKILKY